MKHIHTFILLIFISYVGISQVNEPSQQVKLLWNTPATFTIQSFYEPQIKSRDEAGVISIDQVGPGVYEATLTPNTDFLGTFNFRVEAIPNIFPPQPEYIEFSVDYIKSYVEAADDFVSFDGSEMELFPMLNDTSSVDQFMIKNVSQVVHGTAIVTDSNSIIYNSEVNDVDLDYIVYSVIDTNGVYDLGTVYIRYEKDSIPDHKEELYQIAQGDAQYLFLDGDSFAPVQAYDALEQVSDFAYRYTSEIAQRDTIDFQYGDKTRRYVVEVLEKEIEAGNAKDDLFFTAVNTPVEFDVYENDNSGQFPIVGYSPELTHVGGGVFSYTPVTDDSGLQFFNYTVDYGTHTETAEIRVLVKNFNPVNEFVYELSTLEATELVIDYEVPLSTYSFSAVAAPNFGTVEYMDNATLDLECDELEADKSIIYTPLAGFVGVDEFDIEYCASSYADCVILKVKVDVQANPEDDCRCVNDCIWSGDANGDGKVSTLDLLSISRNLGAVGPARIQESSWVGAEGADYEHNTVYNRNEKYMDTDGDGDVDMNDFTAVEDNYGKYHRFISNDLLGVAETPFFYLYNIEDVDDYQVVNIDFYLGSESIPVVDVEGIAFNISFDADVVDSASVKLHVDDHSFFVKKSPFFADVVQPNDGNLNIVISKSNRQASSGYGKLASLSFIIEDEAIGIIPDLRSASKEVSLGMKVDEIVCQSSEGFSYGLKPLASAIRLKSDGHKNVDSEVFYFPNPASDFVTFQSTAVIQEISIVDLTGRTVKRTKTGEVDVRGIDTGMYIAVIKTDQGVQSKKIEVIR